MSIDTKDHRQIVPESLDFGKDKIILNKPRKAPNYLTITFNPAKIVNGHNLYLLTPDEDIEVIRNLSDFLADFLGSRRYSCLENWNLKQIELSQNRQVAEPIEFVTRFARIAPDQKCSRVHTKNGIHTVVFGPKSKELKLYPKGPQFKKVYGRAFPELVEEANQIVRFERVSNKDGIVKLIGNRSLPNFFEFLSSPRPMEVLESDWNELPHRDPPSASILTDTLLQSHSPSQTRSILGYHYLSREIGETAAIEKLGITRNTAYLYQQKLKKIHSQTVE